MDQGVMVDALMCLQPRQRDELHRRLALLQDEQRWHGGLPVLLLDRCWLRLESVRIDRLASRLPPDSSREAPELARYRELLAAGLQEWQAQQICWQEFGGDACREALQRFWRAQERGNQGWTLERYLALVQEYRQRFFSQECRPLPLLVLARQGLPAASQHDLHWLHAETDHARRSMRHTCA
jgi:hypothetical protein